MRPIPDPQRRAFGLAVCKRLGLDPSIVGDQMQWEVSGADELAPVTLTVYLPADEVLHMFNTGEARA
jgi:hypothetical protein